MVLVEVDGPADEIAFASAADVAVMWAHRNGAEAGTTDVLARALKTLRMPAGDYYAWVACESLTAKALRAQLIADHGANPKWMRAAGLLAARRRRRARQFQRLVGTVPAQVGSSAAGLRSGDDQARITSLPADIARR